MIPHRMSHRQWLAALLVLGLAGCGSSATQPPAPIDHVDAAQFTSASQLHDWQVDLDARGLRATGGPAHEGYVDALYQRLMQTGVEQLAFESTPMMRWTPGAWSLTVTAGASAGPLDVAGYLPYSGVTTADGVTGPLVYVSKDMTPAAGSLAGKIAVVEIPRPPLTLGLFSLLALRSYDPNGLATPATPYDRPYLTISAVADFRDRLIAAGAAGMIAVLDLSPEAAHGAYMPYDGMVRTLPGLFVDRAVGATVKQLAAAGTPVRLVLSAEVKSVDTRNIVAFIPGASDEIVAIHSHTDGTNGIEDNGPNAVVAISAALARLPKKSLPRTVLVLLSSGHFAGGVGIIDFITRHKSDLGPRIKAVLTVEHMGAREWEAGADGKLAPTGKDEPAAIFMPKIDALADAAAAMLSAADAAPAFVLPPLTPSGNGTTVAVWPGEGQYLWALAKIPTANYITGPSYLLNWGITTADKTDFDRMRRESIAMADMLIALGRVPAAKLAAVAQ